MKIKKILWAPLCGVVFAALAEGAELMDEGRKYPGGDRPAIDLERPARTERAVFALG